MTCSSPYFSRGRGRIPCPSCGRIYTPRTLRRHLRSGCPYNYTHTRWRELRRLLVVEANLHGQATTVDRILLLLEMVLHTPISALVYQLEELEETASINSAIAEMEAAADAGSPMDMSTPSNSPAGTSSGSPVAEATAGIASLGL